MRFYKLISDEAFWATDIDEDNIIETIVLSLKEIDAKTVSMYNLKNKMHIKDISTDILEKASFAECHQGDFINLSKLDDNCLYTDSYSDTIYDATTIRNWDTEKYLRFYDGSDWKMIYISSIKEIPVKEDIDKLYNYPTGSIYTYITDTNNIIKVESSMYLGTLDTVIEGTEYLENF